MAPELLQGPWHNSSRRDLNDQVHFAQNGGSPVQWHDARTRIPSEPMFYSSTTVAPSGMVNSNRSSERSS